MKTNVRLSLAVSDYLDRFVGLTNGEIRPDGIDLDISCLRINELFRRAAKVEFDIAEMSVSTYMMMLGKGDRRLVGMPVFPSRAFRHNMIFVHSAAGIRDPRELRGKSVGLSEYQMTAALWVRAFLEYDYGVTPGDIRWVCGGSESPLERYPFSAPDGVTIERRPATESVIEMFEGGKLDALLAFEPQRFKNAAPRITRLFPNYKVVEQEYFRRTGHFPIMHMMVMRREIYEAHPWVMKALYATLDRSKRAGVTRLRDFNSLSVMVPWLEHDLEETDAIFGADSFPYGIDANRPTLDAMIRYAFEQRLIPRRLTIDEMFPGG